MSLTAPAPAGTFALILGNLNRAVAARIIQSPADQAILLLLWRYLQRRIAQFIRLAERVRSNALPPPRGTSPSAPPGTPRPGAPSVGAGRLPSRFAWVAVLVPGSAGFGSQLQMLLATPEMQALIEAAPQQAGRILRPLLRMLAASVPPSLALPKRERRTAPAAPEPDGSATRERAAEPAAPPRPSPWRAKRRRGCIRPGSFILPIAD